MKKKTNCLAALLIALPATAATFDPPDLKLEMKLHQQFRQHQLGVSKPQAGSRVESYRIQQGESLWALSDMLYGDGNYWPRVWATNPKVTNPHLIRQGHNLHFLLGSEDETPSFRISEEDERGVELAANGSQSLIEIPPPEIPAKPVNKVPSSFPQWQSVFKKSAEIGGLDDRALGRAQEKIPDRVYVTAFVQEGELESVGQFMEVDTESALPIVNQYIYVKVKKGTGQPGMRMLLAHDTGRVKRMNYVADYPKDTHLIQIGGEIQLTEAVPAEFSRSRDRNNFDAFRALITTVIDLNTWEFSLIPGQLQQVDLTSSGPSAVANAQIIGAAKHKASTLYGPGEIVFLNKGSSSGIEVGQLMDIFEDRTIRKDTPVKFSPAPSGKLKIAHVSDNLATAVILVSRSGIQQGDQVHEVSARTDSEALDPISSGSSDDEIQFDEGDDSGGESSVEDEIDSEEF